MLHLLGWQGSVFIDTVGHCAGVVLFGLLLVLLSRDRRFQKQQSTLSAMAAALALLWNVCELTALGFSRDPSAGAASLAVVSYGCLSLLPAVLLHISLEDRFRRFAAVGYGVSALSIALQLERGPSLQADASRSSLLVLSFGFAFLSLGAWLWSEYRARRDGLARSANRVAFVSLFILATSYLHFQPGHTTDTWVGEAIWHHAAIPIALIVLLQDFRFLLLDVFLRFILSAGWIALWLWTALTLNGRFHLWTAASRSDYELGLLLTSICFLTFLLSVSLRRLQGLLTRVLFRRPPLDKLVRALQNTRGATEQKLLEGAAEQIANYFRSSPWLAETAERSDGASTTELKPVVIELLRYKSVRAPEWAMVLLPLSFSRGDSARLLLGSREGGRRYLSEDLLGLEKARTVLVERIERFRIEEMGRLVSEAELRALQAQINPHFLFNALNTLYGTIDRTSPEARKLVLNLSELFRARLHTNRSYIPLSEELDLVGAYLEIEAVRLGPRLQVSTTVDPTAGGVLIPVLALQPLVENAVRHGADEVGAVTIRIEVIRRAEVIRVVVQDCGLGFRPSQSAGSGVGLTNVRKRLQLCCRSELIIETSPQGSTVWFEIPAELPNRQIQPAAHSAHQFKR